MYPRWLPERPKITHSDHNGYYHDRLLLQHLPASFDRALDVGCGVGDFARRLAERAEQVDAIDVSPRMITAARASSDNPPNVHWILGDVLASNLELGSYDAVTAIASLHHLPLESGLTRSVEVLRPGGTLVVLGLAKARALSDYAVGTLALAIDPLIGIWKSTGKQSEPPTNGSAMRIPIKDPKDPKPTLTEICNAACRVLPGSRVCRQLSFRYMLMWHKPWS
jgi:ubiquinone/menaquinone biosynthesis C-methylase UbiE